MVLCNNEGNTAKKRMLKENEAFSQKRNPPMNSNLTAGL
jgi:hypothetical protein